MQKAGAWLCLGSGLLNPARGVGRDLYGLWLRSTAPAPVGEICDAKDWVDRDRESCRRSRAGGLPGQGSTLCWGDGNPLVQLTSVCCGCRAAIRATPPLPPRSSPPCPARRGCGTARGSSRPARPEGSRSRPSRPPQAAPPLPMAHALGRRACVPRRSRPPPRRVSRGPAPFCSG